MEKIAVILIAATALILFFGCLIILYALAYQKRRSRHTTEKKEMETRFQSAIMETQIEIQEQTFKNIAQEIHDNIGQVLILAKLNLNTFPPTNDEATLERVNGTKQLVSKAINDLRDLGKILHGDKITELGLYDSVANELKVLQNTGLYKVSLQVDGNKYRMQPQKEMVLFRIVQESIHNAIKHAQPKNIDISLLYGPAFFTLIVADDGAGFDQASLAGSATGIGLTNMKNRATLIGGKLSIQSATGMGTKIKVLIENPGI